MKDVAANFANSVVQQFQVLAEHVFCPKNGGGLPLPLTSFSFGSDSNTIQAVYANSSGLDRWLGDDPKKNLAVVVDLARYGLLQKYVAYTDESFPEAQCTPIEGHFGGNSEPRPPYQLAYRGVYHFDASKCGFFGEKRPMWEVWGDKLTLQPPSLEERVSEGTDVPQIYWDPEAICPDWRLLCNMMFPPNFPMDMLAEPDPEASNTPLPFYRVQLPVARGSSSRQWETDLSNGQLPDEYDTALEWGGFQGIDPACNARDLWEARRARHNLRRNTGERNLGMGVYSLDANGSLVYTPHDNPDAGLVIPPTLRSELPTPGNGNPSDLNEQRMEAFMDKIHPQTRRVAGGVAGYQAALPLIVGAALSALSRA